ncbi:MAG: SHOCT domain-containing protein [Coriobacteriia bacterium]
MMGGPGYGYGSSYGMMGGGWLGGLLMFFFGALVLLGLVLLVVWAVKAASGHGNTMPGPMSHGPAAHDEAMAIAKKRLASGEITKEQYDDVIRAIST